MEGSLAMALLGVSILLFTLGALRWAQVRSDEAELDAVRRKVDKDWDNADQAGPVRTLARQFNVNSVVVEKLHARRQGWGSVTIDLAMAQHLNRIDTAIYPTMTEALNKIEMHHGQNQSWGKIARHLGFKLGPVVSAAQQVRPERTARVH